MQIPRLARDDMLEGVAEMQSESKRAMSRRRGPKISAACGGCVFQSKLTQGPSTSCRASHGTSLGMTGYLEFSDELGMTVLVEMEAELPCVELILWSSY